LADLTDKASDYEEQARDAAISVARVAAQRARLPSVGQCHHCGAEVGPQARFCDAECRDGYEFEQRMRKLTGSR
jgi:hypothetical protein